MPPSMSNKPKHIVEKPIFAWNELVLSMTQPPDLSAMTPPVTTRAMAKKPNTEWTILLQRQ